jgi:hypothetical protein
MSGSEQAGLDREMSESERPPEEHSRWEELIEIVEVAVLALVAVALALLVFTAVSVAGLPLA